MTIDMKERIDYVAKKVGQEAEVEFKADVGEFLAQFEREMQNDNQDHLRRMLLELSKQKDRAKAEKDFKKEQFYTLVSMAAVDKIRDLQAGISYLEHLASRPVVDNNEGE